MSHRPYIVIADDLTGAAEVAAIAHQSGLSAVVLTRLPRRPCAADVIVFDTDARLARAEVCALGRLLVVGDAATLDRPKLAVAGLNPHAGEGGLFGDEEEKYIAPVIAAARTAGLEVHGPFAGDTIFFRTLQGEFDAAVAMYHDQGHVAAKMLGIWRGVNVTLGLPIIRPSAEHGTDFANAGTGRSDPRSLIEALKLAATLARGAKG